MNSFTIDSVRIQWQGHASFLLEGEDKKTYIDPFTSKPMLLFCLSEARILWMKKKLPVRLQYISKGRNSDALWKK